MLRQFLYLDRPLIREFLAQLEGGVYDEERQLTAAEGKKGVGAKAGIAAIGVDAQLAKSHQASSEAIIKQTAASEFDRLYRNLSDTGLQVYDVVD